MEIIGYCVIGLIAGWLAGYLTKGTGFGVVGNLVVGLIGAVVGGFLFSLLDLYATGFIGNLVVATVGAFVLLYGLGLLKQKNII